MNRRHARGRWLLATRPLGPVVVALLTMLMVGPGTIQPVAADVHSAALSRALSPHLTPQPDETASELHAARRHALALQARLDELRARQEWANERLAYVRGERAVAGSRAILAEQELTELESAEAAADADLAHRVRAIEQSGGVAPLYAEALTGASMSDVAASIVALDSAIAGDDAAADAATTAVVRAAQLRARLDEVAAQRARLAARAERFSAELARLESQEQAAYRRASTRVRALSRRLDHQREAAAAALAPTAPSPVTEATSTPYAAPAVNAALSKLGSPYVWGAEGPDTFDCSGLVQWAYLQAGLLLPRLASDQYFASTPVEVADMQPGDLLVYAYDPSDGDTIHHITMYIGNGQMVHAPHTGDVVRVVPVYQDGLYGVARPGL